MEGLTAVGFIFVLAGALAGILAAANARLRVFEDPRIDHVNDLLPGNNCGACGLPGCRAFAEKVVGGEVKPSGCPVGGPDTAAVVADYLGVEAGEAEKRVARLLCAGGTNVAVQMSAYEGHRSCRSAAAVAGGAKGCRWGCLGFGDCMDVCTFDAIAMGPTGLPIVDFAKCTSCGDCVDVCPKGLYEILPESRRLLVQCKSELEGDEVLDYCKVGCTACERCVADAPSGLLTMRRNLPAMNAELSHLQTPDATLRCPTGAIVWVEQQQFEGTAAAGTREGKRWQEVG